MKPRPQPRPMRRPPRPGEAHAWHCSRPPRLLLHFELLLIFNKLLRLRHLFFLGLGLQSQHNAASYGPKDLPRGHHLCFSISNFDSFVQTLKDKGIEVHERPSKMTNPVYFLDPDGNGLEVISADDEE